MLTNVDMKNYLPILENSPRADITEVNEARAKLEKTRENYMLWCSGTREKTLLAFQIWKASPVGKLRVKNVRSLAHEVYNDSLYTCKALKNERVLVDCQYALK